MKNILITVQLHFRNKLHSIIQIILILLSVTLMLVTLQLTVGKGGTISTGMLYIGGWLGFLGPIGLLIRSKNGAGKFLSRLPMTRYEIFLGKVLFLIIVYLMATALLCTGNWIIVGIIKLLQPSLHFSGVPNGQAILNDAITFFKTMPFFLFLGALSLWLQKWIDSNQANLLVIFGLVLILGLIPFFTVLTIQQHSFSISSTDIANFLKSYGKLFVTTLNLAFFFAAMGLYRLRHFRNF
jgi:hypothetical protein